MTVNVSSPRAECGLFRNAAEIAFFDYFNDAHHVTVLGIDLCHVGVLLQQKPKIMRIVDMPNHSRSFKEKQDRNYITILKLTNVLYF